MEDFDLEEKHLNIKKVIAIALIFLFILILIITLIVKKNSKPAEHPQVKTTEKSKTFYSIDNTFSVELPHAFDLKPYNSNLDYLLELRSENNLNIFISKENNIQNKSFLDIIEADKLAYLANFESFSNLSDTKELSINNNPAYTYSFHYLDKNLKQAFYLQVTWLKINNQFYVFDIEFPLDDLEFNTNISSILLSSFKLL